MGARLQKPQCLFKWFTYPLKKKKKKKNTFWGNFSSWLLWFGCGSIIFLKDQGSGPFPYEEAIPSLLDKSTLSIHKGPSELQFLGESPGDATAADSVLSGCQRSKSGIIFCWGIPQPMKSSQVIVPFPTPNPNFLLRLWVPLVSKFAHGTTYDTNACELGALSSLSVTWARGSPCSVTSELWAPFNMCCLVHKGQLSWRNSLFFYQEPEFSTRRILSFPVFCVESPHK